MTSYLHDDWMTNQNMLERDCVHVMAAREVLCDWSDLKVRRVERYLKRFAVLATSRKWAMVIEARLPHLYINKLAPSELSAINILRLVAKGSHDDIDKSLYDHECSTILQIQSRDLGKNEAYKQAAPELENSKKYREHQSKIAKNPRGKGEDGITLGELIANLSQNYLNEKPSEIWPHLKSSIEEWCGGCEENKNGDVYRYFFKDKAKTISFKHFRDRLRIIRKSQIKTTV